MAKIPFSKMSGSGNDFIVIDNRKKLLDADRLGDFIRKVCTRKISVGGDGDPRRTFVAGELQMAFF